MEDKLALAISLIFNLIFLSIPFESVASQSSISGSELSSLITKHLNTLGLEGNPSINNKRIFSGCSSEDIVIQKRDASWKTIQLSCKGNPHWTYNFRNAMDRAKEEQIFDFKRIEKKTASDCKNNVQIISLLNKDAGHFWPGIDRNVGFCFSPPQSNIDYSKCNFSIVNEWGNDFLINLFTNKT